MSITGDRFEFTAKNVNASPDEHGVYALYDGDETIYFGRAAGEGVTIRSRLKSHFDGREGRCTQGATSYRREVTSRPVNREKELLEEYESKYGKLPRCNKKIA